MTRCETVKNQNKYATIWVAVIFCFFTIKSRRCGAICLANSCFMPHACHLDTLRFILLLSKTSVMCSWWYIKFKLDTNKYQSSWNLKWRKTKPNAFSLASFALSTPVRSAVLDLCVIHAEKVKLTHSKALKMSSGCVNVSASHLMNIGPGFDFQTWCDVTGPASSNQTFSECREKQPALKTTRTFRLWALPRGKQVVAWTEQEPLFSRALNPIQCRPLLNYS